MVCIANPIHESEGKIGEKPFSEVVFDENRFTNARRFPKKCKRI